MLTKSMKVERDCYERFKGHYPQDMYKDVLDTYREMKQLERTGKGERVSTREKGFSSLFERTAKRVNF